MLSLGSQRSRCQHTISACASPAACLEADSVCAVTSVLSLFHCVKDVYQHKAYWLTVCSKPSIAAELVSLAAWISLKA